MKRIVTIILLLVAVLQMAGASTVSADSQEMDRKKDFIINNKDEILEITKDKNLSAEKISCAYTQLDELSKTCDKLREDGNESDARKGDILLNQFIKDFYSAITRGSNDSSLDISTNKYEEIAGGFCKESSQFCSSILKENDPQNTSEAETKTTPAQKVENQSNTGWMEGSFFVLLVLGILLLVLLLVKSRGGLKELKELNKELIKKLSSLKKDIDTLNNNLLYYGKGTSRMPTTLTDCNSNKQSKTVVPTILHKEEVKKKKAPVESKTRSLYASANAKGSVEFKNTSESKFKDHVFVLILKNPNEKEAEFALAELEPEFEKEVINNKDSYLPPAFCDKDFPHSGKVSKIETIARGKAVMENGNWTVREKMKVKFI